MEQYTTDYGRKYLHYLKYHNGADIEAMFHELPEKDQIDFTFEAGIARFEDCHSLSDLSLTMLLELKTLVELIIEFQAAIANDAGITPYSALYSSTLITAALYDGFKHAFLRIMDADDVSKVVGHAPGTDDPSEDVADSIVFPDSYGEIVDVIKQVSYNRMSFAENLTEMATAILCEFGIVVKTGTDIVTAASQREIEAAKALNTFELIVLATAKAVSSLMVDITEDDK